MLEVVDVAGGYRPDMEILHGVSLRVDEGEMVSIIGPNGAGKSTVLRSIFGMLRLTRGSVTFLGRDITRATTMERLRLGISFVPQGHTIFPEMTVEENLELGAYIRRDSRIAADIRGAYEAFPDLYAMRKRAAGYLSGGQMQMLEMARARLLHPKLILIDEPSLGLSPKIAKFVFAQIADLKGSGVAVLIVEQNAEASLSMSDRAYVVTTGAVSHEGPAEAVRTDPDIRQAYLGARAGPRARGRAGLGGAARSGARHEREGGGGPGGDRPDDSHSEAMNAARKEEEP